MIAFYPQIKLMHIAAVVVSGGFFFVRGTGRDEAVLSMPCLISRLSAAHLTQVMDFVNHKFVDQDVD